MIRERLGVRRILGLTSTAPRVHGAVSGGPLICASRRGHQSWDNYKWALPTIPLPAISTRVPRSHKIGKLLYILHGAMRKMFAFWKVWTLCRAMHSFRKGEGGEIQKYGSHKVKSACTIELFTKMGVKSTVLELLRSLKYKSLCTINSLKNEEGGGI